jgi:hypothetical protein
VSAAPSRLRTAAFILSDVRSGSTLLDQCLGANSAVVTLGEAHWLPAYVTQDRSQYDPVHPLTCACGKSVPDCEFWSSVRLQIGRPLESLTLHSRFGRMSSARGLAAKFRFLPRRIVRENPVLYRLAWVRRALGASRLSLDISDLQAAACSATARNVCVDSSKSPFRFRAVYELDPTKAQAIVLARDFRAVVHSKMKRGEKLDAAARGWAIAMRQIDALTRDLPSDRVHCVKYEQLCENPRAELVKLCGFLGIPFEEAMLRRPEPGSVHHIGGSPSKFDASRAEISLDRTYEGAFTAAEIDRMRRLIGDEAIRWRY